MDYSTLQGILYFSGTLIPTTHRYGPLVCLYDTFHNKSLEPNKNGCIRLEGSGVYVTKQSQERESRKTSRISFTSLLRRKGMDGKSSEDVFRQRTLSDNTVGGGKSLENLQTLKKRRQSENTSGWVAFTRTSVPNLMGKESWSGNSFSGESSRNSRASSLLDVVGAASSDRELITPWEVQEMPSVLELDQQSQNSMEESMRSLTIDEEVVELESVGYFTLKSSGRDVIVDIVGNITTCNTIQVMNGVRGELRMVLESSSGVEFDQLGYVELDNYIIKVYSNDKNLIYAFSLMGCLALVDMRYEEIFGFNVVVSGDLSVLFYASDRESMLKWIAGVNTACCNLEYCESLVQSGKGEKLKRGGLDCKSEYNALVTHLYGIVGLDRASNRDSVKPSTVSNTATLLTEICIPKAETEAELVNNATRTNLNDSLILSNAADSVLKPINEHQDSVDVKYELNADGTANRALIVAASEGKLVEKLVSVEEGEGEGNEEFVEAFLLTYRHFTVPKKVLERLSIGFVNGGISENESEKLTIMRIRSIRIVTKWIGEYKEDFVDMESNAALYEFINAVKSIANNRSMVNVSSGFDFFVDYNTLSRLLTRVVEKVIKPIAEELHQQSKERKESNQSKERKESKESPKLQFDQLKHNDIATQLTLLESLLFQSLSPIEFALYLWPSNTNPSNQSLTKSFKSIIDSFNKHSHWVATEICTQPELKIRVKIIETFIKAARDCKKLQNYNSMMALISGLNMSAVTRLKETWQLIQPKHMQILRGLEVFCAPQQNYKIYRQALSGLDNGSAIPFFGLFVKDLFVLNDSNPKRFEGGLVNFEKLRTVYERIVHFVEIGKREFKVVGGGEGYLVKEYIESVRPLSEKALYKYSCLCEAKKGEGEERLINKWKSAK